ncbi:hypothetical protein VTI74DRAFT_7045 [Chaetomium olivicolor]
MPLASLLASHASSNGRATFTPSPDPPTWTLAVEPPALSPTSSFLAPCYLNCLWGPQPRTSGITGLPCYGQDPLSRSPLHEAGSTNTNGDSPPRHMHPTLFTSFSEQSKLVSKPIRGCLLGNCSMITTSTMPCSPPVGLSPGKGRLAGGVSPGGPGHRRHHHHLTYPLLPGLKRGQEGP